jgi:PKD repeat protein
MRKLYALLAGYMLCLASANAGTVTPDVANFTFTINAPNNSVAFTNTSVLGSEPGIRKAFWFFGDGSVRVTPPLDNTQHQYQVGGVYNVCLKIYRYRPNLGDSVLSAQICKTLEIPTYCSADFNTLSVASSPLLKYFVAQPYHNRNKKPVQVCWLFGDGRDTCIQYPENYSGQYGVSHHYNQPGNYNVCVKIVYQGGCEANKCKLVQVTNPDNCTAAFQRGPVTANNPLLASFIAQPWHSNNKKPVLICWTFGDGRDTCIQYLNTFPGPYTVSHTYQHPGLYEVCVKILYQGGCEARKCDPIRIGRPDTCAVDFQRLNISPTPNPLTVVYKPLLQHNNNRKPQTICWEFGDGRDTCINYLNIYNGSYNVTHTYQHPGLYNVCVKVQYYGGCIARKCKPVQVGRPDTCATDFERLPVADPANPLKAFFKAQPLHNNNRKPARVCWAFGDGADTCINYPETFNGPYTVSHRYNQAGQYQVCVKILYYGGCEARKCKPVVITRPDTCRADFERVQVNPANPLEVYLKALPQHNNNRKPARICWSFGDGTDTCYNYPESYTGLYLARHRYNHPGLYEVCIKILYYGGCEARKCKPLQVGRPDTCAADFERVPVSSINPLLAGFKALPQHNNNRKPSKVCWSFGDGSDTCINYPATYTGLYAVAHRYNQPGRYEVCVKIFYYGGCEARKCKPVQIGRPDTCDADFERLPVVPSNNPLTVAFKALPSHNNNRKPAKICWSFGDGDDTCINYPNTYTGIYGVRHTYRHPGLYPVCVKILYYGGCEARKCKPIQVGRPDTCTADFERLPVTGTSPLLQGFKAIPQHNNNRKPAKICWAFGDGRDTCINYPENYSGQYVVTHRYSQPGQYTVCVKILYYGGCEARKCKAIVIPPIQNCNVNLFEITPSITSLVRGFLAVPSATPPSRPVRVCWYFGDGDDTCIMIDPQQPLPTLMIRHTYPGPGHYRACVKVRFQNGCIAEDCKEVVIRSTANVCGGYMLDSLMGPRTYKFKGFSINAPNDEVISYRWTFGDGTSALGREVTHTYNQAGDFRVCLTINTRLGCETRICKTVRVPGNNQPALVITPNPVLTVLNAAFFSTHTETVNIRVLNANGIVIRNFTRNANVGPNNWTFDASSLMPGIYSMVVQSPNQLASALFIKQ